VLEQVGLLQRLERWLADGPRPGLQRPRPVVVGTAADHVAAVAAQVQTELIMLPAADTQTGEALVDREVDSGCDLLLLAAPDGAAVPATIGIAAFAGEEPVRALGFDATLADDEWVRRAVAVRDGLRRIDLVGDRAAALASLGDPALATATGIVAQAAQRRTPIVLDGLTALAAAVLVAHFGELDPQRCLIASADRRPAAGMAARVLGLVPVMDLGWPSGDGLAALLTLPLLHAAQLAPSRDDHGVTPGLTRQDP